MNHLFVQNSGTTQVLILNAPLRNILSAIHYLDFKIRYRTKSIFFFFLISGKGGIVIMQENTKRQNSISKSKISSRNKHFQLIRVPGDGMAQ